MLRRLKIFGPHYDEGMLIDLLNENGGIVSDMRINKEQFEYMRRVLKFKVKNTEDNG